MSTLGMEKSYEIFDKVKNSHLQRQPTGRGAPCRFKAELMFEAFIFRLRTALPLRFSSVMFSIPLTTLFRHCRRLAHLLADLHERDAPAHEADHLIVDTTSTRVRSTDLR